MTTTHNPKKAEGINEVHERFLSYVYTMSLLKTRLRGFDEDSFVRINQKEVEARFFIWPFYTRFNEIRKLIKEGYLQKELRYIPEIGRKVDYYKCLRPCTPDPSLVIVDEPVLGETQKFMLNCLLNTSLKEGSTSTTYFDFFLQYKSSFPFHFFKFDGFSGRLHTPVTSLPGQTRKNLLLFSEPVVSLDVNQMQPQILGKILKDNLRRNEFSIYMDAGADIYKMFAGKYKLHSREAGKKRFFEILYSRPNQDLLTVFGYSNWIEWVNNFKKKRIKANPHAHKPHSNIAWLLQKKEVEIMKSVWIALRCAGIPFLTVHDEIICKESDKKAVSEIFSEILKENFVNCKIKIS